MMMISNKNQAYLNFYLYFIFIFFIQIIYKKQRFFINRNIPDRVPAEVSLTFGRA